WHHRVLWGEQSRVLELPRLYEESVSPLSGSLCRFNLYQTFVHGCEVRVPNRPRNNLVPSCCRLNNSSLFSLGLLLYYSVYYALILSSPFVQDHRRRSKWVCVQSFYI